MKTPAVVFFRLYERMQELPKALREISDLVILSDKPLSELSEEKSEYINISSVINEDKLKEQRNAEVNARLAVLFSNLQTHLSELPFSDSLLSTHTASLEARFRRGLENFFYYAFLMEDLIKQFNVKCILCSPSFLDRNQGVIAVAKFHNIPSIHIQHGAWISPESFHPECADTVTLADEFGRKILNQHSISNAERIVTGLPFAETVSEDVLNPSRSLEARQKLNIAKETEVILYGASFGEGLALYSSTSLHKNIESLQWTLRAAQRRTAAGKKTLVLIRQHPSSKRSEDIEAFRLIAEDIGYLDIRMSEEPKEILFAACDLVVSCTPDSSFVLDAFSSGRPVVSTNAGSSAAHNIDYTLIAGLRPICMDEDTLVHNIDKLLDDRNCWIECRDKAFEFMRSIRTISKEESLKNFVDLITRQLH